MAPVGDGRFAISWYSSPPANDPSWLEGFGGRTDIWTAGIDLRKLGPGVRPVFR